MRLARYTENNDFTLFYRAPGGNPRIAETSLPRPAATPEQFLKVCMDQFGDVYQDKDYTFYVLSHRNGELYGPYRATLIPAPSWKVEKV